MSVAARVVSGSLTGLVFGALLESSGVADPNVIRKQFTFEDNTMLKMFLSASASSALVFTALKARGSCPNTKPLKYMNNALGGVIMGAGMAVCGACSGTVFAQLGAMDPNAPLVAVGGIAGAISYGFAKPKLENLLAKGVKGPISFDSLLKAPFWKVSVPMAATMLATVVLVDKYMPASDRQKESHVVLGVQIPQAVSTAAASGLLVGALQIPAYKLGSNTLGTSGAFGGVASNIMALTSKQGASHPLFKGMLGAGAPWWQYSAVSSMILGSYLSSHYLNKSAAPRDGVTPYSAVSALSGGWLVLFGARMAEGCTSGHGLSGLGLLSAGSAVTVGAMFGGAIVVGMALKAIRGDDAKRKL